MRTLAIHNAKLQGALLFNRGAGSLKSACKPCSNDSHPPASPVLIGNEMPHLHPQVSAPPSDSEVIVEIQNQALRMVLVDYEKQIDRLKIMLTSVRQSLVELQQQLARSPAAVLSGQGGALDCQSMIGRLINRVSHDAPTWEIPEPVIVTCTMLRTAYPQLTRSESKVAAYIFCGFATADIALMFSVSERTIENHRLHIRQKLAISTKKNLKVFLEGSLSHR